MNSIFILILLIPAIFAKPIYDKMQAYYEMHLKDYFKDKEYAPEKLDSYSKEIADHISKEMNDTYQDYFVDTQVFLLDSKTPCYWAAKKKNYDDYDYQEIHKYQDDKFLCVSFVYMYDKSKRSASCGVPTFLSMTEQIKNIANVTMDAFLGNISSFDDNQTSQFPDEIANEIEQNLEATLPGYSHGISVFLTKNATNIAGISIYYGENPGDGVTTANYNNSVYWCGIFIDGIQNR